MTQKTKVLISIAALVMMGTIFGHVLSDILGYLLFDQYENRHVCTCDYCKTTRQLEALEVIDSIISDRITIDVIGKED